MYGSRLAVLVTTVLLTAGPADACTFCGESLRTKPTLRQHYAAAKVVVSGQLRNPRFDPATDAGFTDLHVTAVLKDDPARTGQAVITLREYIPVIGNTPSEYVAFFGVVGGKSVVSHGTPAPARLVEYLKGGIL